MTFVSQIAVVVSRSCPPLRSSVFAVDQGAHENTDGDDVPQHD